MMQRWISIVAIILTFLITNNSFAQDDINQLEQQLNEPSLSAYEKVAVRNDLIWALRNKDLVKAKALIELNIQLSQQNDWQDHLAKKRIFMGDC